MKHIKPINEMAVTKLEMKKTLDVQWGTPKMPDDVKRYFFDMGSYCNDVWVEYTVCGDERNMLDDWLLANTDVNEGEEILLKHWW